MEDVMKLSVENLKRFAFCVITEASGSISCIKNRFDENLIREDIKERLCKIKLSQIRSMSAESAKDFYGKYLWILMDE